MLHFVARFCFVKNVERKNESQTKNDQDNAVMESRTGGMDTDKNRQYSKYSVH